MSLLAITNARVVTMDPARRVLENGTILIENQSLIAVGPSDEIKIPAGATVIDGKGFAALPGFVNVHTHVNQILLRGGPSHDRGLYDWLFNILYPGLAVYTPADARVAVKLYCAEAIRSGITTAVDNADSAQYPGIPAASIETYQECGLRTVYARMFFDKTAPELNTLIQNFIDKEPGIKHVKNLETTAHALAEIEKLFKTYHKTSHDRIHIWPAPAMPCVITPEGMRGSRALAHQYGTNWTMHMAETGMEEKVHWMSPIEYTDTLGCLDSKLLLAHCVFSDQKDIRLLKRNDTKVATQAVSNAYLASGIAPIPAMIAAGVTVGLGTDDANCNDSVNFVTDMKIFALLHRALHRDAAILSPEKILEVATIDGARALGMEKSIGSLEVGKKADVILIDLRHPQTTPNHNLPATLVFQACGNEVDTVIIDGEIVMQNRALKFLPPAEEAAFYADAQTRSGEILQRSGIPATRAWRSI